MSFVEEASAREDGEEKNEDLNCMEQPNPSVPNYTLEGSQPKSLEMEKVEVQLRPSETRTAHPI
jgi:hypothetical protein